MKKKLKDFKPLPEGKNPNVHSAFGLGLLEDSMQSDGFVGPMTAAADGTVLDGNARLEKSADIFETDPIIVEHDGTRPVIMVRTDIPDAESETAKRIIVGANRIAQANLTWDTEVLKTMVEEVPSIAPMWSAAELEKMLNPQNASFGGMQVDEEQKFMVIVDCPNEAAQTTLLNRLIGEGWTCKAVQSGGSDEATTPTVPEPMWNDDDTK